MNIERGEYYLLLMFSISGMMLMAYAYDLIIVFLALELLSIPLYILAGFARPRVEFGRSLAEVLPAGLICLGFRAVRHRPGLWGHRPAPTCPASSQADDGSAKRNPALFLVGAALFLVGFWLQGGGGALPHVGAGCLPGRALAGDRFYVGGASRRPGLPRCCACS